MSIQVIRDWRNIPNIIIQEVIMKYGWEKDFILSNIVRCFSGGKNQNPVREELYLFFECIEKEKFYQFLNELIEIGALQIID